MAVVFTSDSTIEKIVDELEKLTPEQRHILLLKLKKKELLARIKIAGKGIRPERKPSDEKIAEMVAEFRKKK